MQKLVVIEGMSPCDVVRYYFAECTDEECEDLLLCETIYPFGDLEWIAEEVWECYLKSKEI